MKDDKQMFETLRESANPVHPDRLNALRRIEAQPARPRLLPAALTGALTVALVLVAVAMVARRDGLPPDGEARLGAGGLGKSSSSDVPKGQARIAIECGGDSVLVTIRNNSAKVIELYTIEAFDEDDTFGPGQGQRIEHVNAKIANDRVYTFPLPASFLVGDPARRMVGVFTSATAHGQTCSAPPHQSEAFVVPEKSLPPPAAVNPKPEGHVGADADSPWGIPSTELSNFELENAGSSQSLAESELTKLLLKHDGKQLLQNEWVLREVRRADPKQKVEVGGVYFVADGRYRFDSPEQASAFLAGSIDAARRERHGLFRDIERVDDAPDIGDDTLLYKGALAGSKEDAPPVQGQSTVYGIGFRTGTVVSLLFVDGDEGMTEEQVLRLAQVAEKRVREAQDEGR